MANEQKSVIRVGLLGADASTPALIRALVTAPGFELAGYCEEEGSVVSLSQALAPFGGRVRPFPTWEALLDQQAVDGVIVAQGDNQDARADQLRKLLQAGMPVLVAHPISDSMLIYYELDMIRRETHCVAMPQLAERRHPALLQLAEFLRHPEKSPIGKIEQVQFERCLARTDPLSVARQFSRDVDCIRAIAGDMTRLGAMASNADPALQPAASASLSGLGVQMSGPSGVVARWGVTASQGTVTARVILHGADGRATVDMAGPDQPWNLEVLRGSQRTSEAFASWDPAAELLDVFAGGIRGGTITPDWIDACRSVELAETIERSLKKNRTIELYYEDYTEQGTFKGTMTSLGCGLLLLAMILLGVVGLAEQLGVPFLRGWPFLLLGCLGAFLLLQMLLLVFRGTDRSGD